MKTIISKLNFSASSKLQRMATCLLHFVPFVCWLLRAEHVRGRGGGELPPVQGGAGAGGESRQGSQESKEDWGQEEKWVELVEMRKQFWYHRNDGEALLHRFWNISTCYSQISKCLHLLPLKWDGILRLHLNILTWAYLLWSASTWSPWPWSSTWCPL